MSPSVIVTFETILRYSIDEFLSFDGDALQVELLQEATRGPFRIGHRHLRRSRLRATASIIGHNPNIAIPASHRASESTPDAIFRDPPPSNVKLRL